MISLAIFDISLPISEMIPFFTRRSALYVSVAVMMVPFFIKVVICSPACASEKVFTLTGINHVVRVNSGGKSLRPSLDVRLA